MKVVIEIDDAAFPDTQVRRMLADMNRRQETEADDHWIDLETPLTKLNVSRVVGIVDPKYDALVPYIAPMEET